jgi:hypothetical protein
MLAEGGGASRRNRPDAADAAMNLGNRIAWRHNATAFLQTLYVNVTLGSDKADDVMLPGLEAALKAKP